MIVQKIWASLIGAVSCIIGILGALSFIHIPLRDAIIHIITGILFLIGGWIKAGRFSSVFNVILGVFYIIFGIAGRNWPHLIAGLVSFLIGLWFRRTHFN